MSCVILRVCCWREQGPWPTVADVTSTAGLSAICDPDMPHQAVSGRDQVCAFYQRSFTVTGPDGPMPPKQWVRHEWARSGLSLQRANEACGVKNAATRKYLTKDWLWYWPPGEMTERLAAYANAHGLPTGWPYYSLDGERPVTAAEWDALR